MKKLLSLLLAISGVSSLSIAAMASPCVDRTSHSTITPVSLSEAIAQNDTTTTNEDLQTGMEEFDWDLPNQNPPTQFGSFELQPIRLTEPPTNEEGDGLAITIDFTDLDRLENVTED
ncbi:hypothetical protein [Phormidium sp. CCY1219]|uniref:hypothetical protein n=1 Tax=Phormidium sp. CCY1219 TaxID=2886104 RepID=UPI002D1E665C|nr:hypothetical protein [Phormidium sp. CCY1219]MEB3831905.1 hypothetical protein [Phormidium sp. CCY1219]